MANEWLGEDIERELSDGRMAAPMSSQLGLASRVLVDGANIVSLPTVSPLAVGHLVAFSRACHKSFAAVTAANADAHAEVGRLFRRHKDLYRHSLIFEHGMAPTDSEACGVTRAHFHLIPFARPADLLEALEGDLGSPQSRNSGWSDPRLAGTEYIRIGEDPDRITCWFGAQYPSQLVRRHLARMLALPEWDWKRLFNFDMMQTTIEQWSTAA